MNRNTVYHKLTYDVIRHVISCQNYSILEDSDMGSCEMHVIAFVLIFFQIMLYDARLEFHSCSRFRLSERSICADLGVGVLRGQYSKVQVISSNVVLVKRY